MKAEIIAVGSELLTPDRIDTNSLFLTEELNKLGIEVLRKTIVGDRRELLAEAFRDALNRVPVVIASGGLGPTEDDLTRETLADLLGRRLARNDDVVRAIEARFRSFNRDMPAVNLRQAMVPEGAEVLENPRGTAPGLWLEDKGRSIALLPGPPRGFSSTSAPSGTMACRRFTAGMSRLKLRKRASMARTTSSLRSKRRPSRSARVSRVRSSSVGPRPPLAITTGTRFKASRKASASSSRRSPTMVLRRTSIPSLLSSSVRNSELVSIRSGVSNSEPTAMISAFMPDIVAHPSEGTVDPCRAGFL